MAIDETKLENLHMALGMLANVRDRLTNVPAFVKAELHSRVESVLFALADKADDKGMLFTAEDLTADALNDGTVRLAAGKRLKPGSFRRYKMKAKKSKRFLCCTPASRSPKGKWVSHCTFVRGGKKATTLVVWGKKKPAKMLVKDAPGKPQRRIPAC